MDNLIQFPKSPPPPDKISMGVVLLPAPPPNESRGARVAREKADLAFFKKMQKLAGPAAHLLGFAISG